MLSLLELVSQNQPRFQTHQALLIIGLQNDFILSDGKLPVNTHNGFLDRIHALIPTFRRQSSNVVWIKTLYDADRQANDPATGEGDAVVVGGLVDGAESSTDDDDILPTVTASKSSKHKQRALELLKRVSARRRTGPSTGSGSGMAVRGEGQPSAADADANDDEELFLRPAARTSPACVPNTPGADFVESIRPQIELSDTVVQTANYSAFQGTSLLLILRARLVTELYICGCITNVSVLATVVDAARHGIRINVVQDCLGFRKQSRHDVALRRMVDFFDANMVTSSEVMARPATMNKASAAGDGDGDEKSAGLDGLVDKMRLSEARPRPPRPCSTGESPPATPNVHQRRPSDASAADSRATHDTRLSDEQFADALAQGAQLNLPRSSKQPAASAGAKPGLVKTKIRMRSRGDKGKKDDDKKSRAESSKKGEPKGGHKGEPSSSHSPAKHTQEQAPAPADSPRPTPSVVKSGSIDKLRETSSKADRPLKLSASHPALSSSHLDTKEKSSTSRLRLGLSRASKSDLRKDASQSPQTPPKSATDAVAPASPAAVQTPKMGKPSKLPSLATLPVLRPGDTIAEGDSRILYDFFPDDFHHPSEPSKPLKELIFSQLYNEVRWQTMMHQQGEVPRLVCCQGEFSADGSMPVYRHPTDQTLPLLHFSPKVQVVRKRAEELAGHPLNHVLIQLYRTGNDYISEHSDKTLDIVKGSSIVNVSFGAQRTMRLRTKKSRSTGNSDEDSQRETQRVAMPHNSMFVLGLKSNEKWLHGIMADKRLPVERSPEETAFSGIRISLTFRHIGTFLDARSSVIWGQGATTKDQRDACDVINNDEEETEQIVRAFSRENHSADFDWEEWYGDGFDVLHLHAPPKDLPILFESHNTVEVKMIKIFLTEQKIDHVVCEAPVLDPQYEADRQVVYRDNDVNHTEILYAMPTVLYLDRYYPFDTDDRGRYCTSQSYDLFIQISAMMKFWHNRQEPSYLDSALNMLRTLEERFAFGPGPFIAGRRFSIGDCGTWPALDELITNYDGWTEERYPKLTAYYKMLWKKKKSVQMLRAELPRIKKSSKDRVDEARKEEQDL